MRSSERSIAFGCSARAARQRRRAAHGGAEQRSRRRCGWRRPAEPPERQPVRPAHPAGQEKLVLAPARSCPAPWSAAGTAAPASARSSWRCTTMSTMPWSRRYSARWKPSGSFSRMVCSMTRGAGKADQRAGLGDVHVAQHGIGGGDAAGGRIGQHHDIGQACLAQHLHGDRGARHLHQRQDAFLHARAAGRGEQDEGRAASRPRVSSP